MLQQTFYNSFAGQSLYDVAAAVYGDATLADDLAIENGISVTDELTPGQKILLIDGKIKQEVIKVYSNAGVIPATAESATDETIIITPGGIGYMAIGTTFRVS